jgi:hypothetical protein
MTPDKQVAALMLADPRRMRMLRSVRALQLPDCWVGAGFVRSAVWDHLHGRAPGEVGSDIDVVWYDPQRTGGAFDSAIEHQLARDNPEAPWSVKNQADMHERNGDRPYGSTADAMAHWPETATAVAVRLQDGAIEIAAPFGLEDLFALVLRPTPPFRGDKLPVFHGRIATKRWLERWPKLVIVTEP